MRRLPRSSRQLLPAVRSRALWLALIAIAAVSAVAGALSASSAEQPPATAGSVRVVRLLGGPRPLQFDLPATAAAVRREVLAAVPRQATVRRGRAAITYRYDRAITVRRVQHAASHGGGVVRVPRRAISSDMAVTILRQAQRNTCESAALSMLLQAAGVRAGQRVLQARLPRSGSLDPIARDGARVWGDPERGFVGRANGGGTAGGFGVYPPPVAALARTYLPSAKNLTGVSARTLYARVRAGRPVMAWLGLSEGPYASWSTPSGRRITVNLNEHTVVLVGITASGMLRVADPLDGTAQLVSRAAFETMWQRLGRRAVTA